MTDVPTQRLDYTLVWPDETPPPHLVNQFSFTVIPDANGQPSEVLLVAGMLLPPASLGGVNRDRDPKIPVPLEITPVVSIALTATRLRELLKAGQDLVDSIERQLVEGKDG